MSAPDSPKSDLARLARSGKGVPEQRPSRRLLTTSAEPERMAFFQLYVPEQTRRDFKAEAASRGMSSSALFKELWAAYPGNSTIHEQGDK